MGNFCYVYVLFGMKVSKIYRYYFDGMNENVQLNGFSFKRTVTQNYI
jgi:hypothetical protein